MNAAIESSAGASKTLRLCRLGGVECGSKNCMLVRENTWTWTLRRCSRKETNVGFMTQRGKVKSRSFQNSHLSVIVSRPPNLETQWHSCLWCCMHILSSNRYIVCTTVLSAFHQSCSQQFQETNLVHAYLPPVNSFISQLRQRVVCC